MVVKSYTCNSKPGVCRSLQVLSHRFNRSVLLALLIPGLLKLSHSGRAHGFIHSCSASPISATAVIVHLRQPSSPRRGLRRSLIGVPVSPACRQAEPAELIDDRPAETLCTKRTSTLFRFQEWSHRLTESDGFHGDRRGHVESSHSHSDLPSRSRYRVRSSFVGRQRRISAVAGSAVPRSSSNAAVLSSFRTFLGLSGHAVARSPTGREAVGGGRPAHVLPTWSGRSDLRSSFGDAISRRGAGREGGRQELGIELLRFFACRN